MNQRLISEKVYVTPDMKKKKKLFKIEFIMSVFLLCVLSSYAIYAEYDRNKSEEVSKEILDSMSFTPSGEKKLVQQDAIVVILNKDKKQASSIQQVVEQDVPVPEVQKNVASDGTEYYTIGQISIPSINVNYPILSTWSIDLLKISACKFWGPNPNEVGNLCIIGHNYRNSKFFSKVPTLENGAQIQITDLTGRTITYEVYDKYTIDPTDVGCTSQKTDGQKEITLITCTNDSKQRVVVKARAIE